MKKGDAIPLSGTASKLQLNTFYERLNIEGDFKVFDGWLRRRQKRHVISQISRETNSRDIEVKAKFPKQFV